MTKTENLKLISGSFSAEEASSILFGLVKNKINFHNLEIAHINETGVGNPAKSEQRLSQLRNLEQDIQQIIAEAKKENAQLTIDGTINVKITS